MPRPCCLRLDNPLYCFAMANEGGIRLNVPNHSSDIAASRPLLLPSFPAAIPSRVHVDTGFGEDWVALFQPHWPATVTLAESVTEA